MYFKFDVSLAIVFETCTLVFVKWKLSQAQAGTIIGDGDRKSWDPRGPMMWDNFSSWITNCAILTSYIRADPRTCGGFSRGCCHIAWSNFESCEILMPIFFIVMGSTMYFYAQSSWFFRVEDFFNFNWFMVSKIFFFWKLGGQDIFFPPKCSAFFFSPHFSAGFFSSKKVSCLHLQNVFIFTLWLLQ